MRTIGKDTKNDIAIYSNGLRFKTGMIHTSKCHWETTLEENAKNLGEIANSISIIEEKIEQSGSILIFKDRLDLFAKMKAYYSAWEIDMQIKSSIDIKILSNTTLEGCYEDCCETLEGTFYDANMAPVFYLDSYMHSEL